MLPTLKSCFKVIFEKWVSSRSNNGWVIFLFHFSESTTKLAHKQILVFAYLELLYEVISRNWRSIRGQIMVGRFFCSIFRNLRLKLAYKQILMFAYLELLFEGHLKELGVNSRSNNDRVFFLIPFFGIYG